MAAGLRLEITVDDKGSAKIKKIEGAHNRLEKRVVSGSGRMSAAVGRLNAKWGAMKGRISSVSRIAKIALAGLAVAAVVVGAKFEQSMANVGAILGKTRSEMGLFIATARQLGATTVFSASQAAEAMYSLASAGQTATQILATAPSVLLFAGAAATDLGSAAEILVQTLAMFNLQAEESSRVVNVFAASIAGSLLNAERLKEGLSQVGSTAAALDLGLEETVAILGKLNSAGQVGGIAGTRLKNVLTRLAAPNAVLRDLMGEVTLKTDGFAASMAALADADPGKIFQAFGRIAAPAVLVLRNMTKELGELQAQITGTNKAQEMFNIQMNTVQSQFRIFKSQLQENMIATFFALRDAGFDALGGLTQALADLKPPLVAIVSMTVKWVRENKNTLATLGKITGAVLAAVAAWFLLTNPITWVAAAIVALTAVWNKWGKQITATLENVTTRTEGLASTIIDALGFAFDAVGGFAKIWLNAVIGHIVFMSLNFWDLGKTIVNALRGPFQWIVDRFKGLIDFAGPLLKKIGIAFGKTFESITADLQTEVEEQEGIMGRAGRAIAANAEQAYGTDYVGAVAGGLGAALNVARDKLGQMKAEFKALAAEVASAGGAGPTKEQQLLFNVGLAVASGGPKLTPEQELAQKRAALEAQMTAEINSAEDVEDVRRASLVSVIGAEQTHTKEWLAARLELIRSNYDEETLKASDSAEEVATLKLNREAEVAEAQMVFQDSVVENFMANNELMVIQLQMLEAAYDTFFNTILDKEMTGKKRREVIWKSMQTTFIKSTTGMIKAYVSEWLKGLLVTEAASTAHHARERLKSAKDGAVKAFSAFASIPFIGPLLGAAAAAAAFSFLMAFQKGGQVPGIGFGRDTVPAILEPQEFVINKTAAANVGAENLETINRTGSLPAGRTQVPTGDINLNFDIGAGGTDIDEMKEYLEEIVVPELENIRERRRGF